MPQIPATTRVNVSRVIAAEYPAAPAGLRDRNTRDDAGAGLSRTGLDRNSRGRSESAQHASDDQPERVCDGCGRGRPLSPRRRARAARSKRSQSLMRAILQPAPRTLPAAASQRNDATGGRSAEPDGASPGPTATAARARRPVLLQSRFFATASLLRSDDGAANRPSRSTFADPGAITDPASRLHRLRQRRRHHPYRPWPRLHRLHLRQRRQPFRPLHLRRQRPPP